MYNALQPLVSQLDEKPSRGRILTQLGAIELAFQREHPKMPYTEVLANSYEQLARDLEGESMLFFWIPLSDPEREP